jgi:hypothetical protein
MVSRVAAILKTANTRKQSTTAFTRPSNIRQILKKRKLLDNKKFLICFTCNIMHRLNSLNCTCDPYSFLIGKNLCLQPSEWGFSCRSKYFSGGPCWPARFGGKLSGWVICVRGLGEGSAGWPQWHLGWGQEYRKKPFLQCMYVLLLTSGTSFNNIHTYLDIVNPYWYRWELSDPHGALGRHAVTRRLLDKRLGLTSRLRPKIRNCFPYGTII